MAGPAGNTHRCREDQPACRTAPRSARGKARRALAGSLAVALLAGACAGPGPQPSLAPAAPPAVSAGEQRLGISVVAVRLSADGYMLDVRYRVNEPERALPILDRTVQPHLVDEASGARFGIPSGPTVGPMRQITERPEAGRVYWLLFANPGRFVKRGAAVTVVVGDVALEHLVVQ